MSEPNVTLEQFKQWLREYAPAAKAVLAARVFAEAERKRVDAYILPLFESYQFEYEGELAKQVGAEGRIHDPKFLYLADDAKCERFYKECDALHREHGFTGPEGHCPALIAEHAVVEAETALIELAKPLFGVEVWQLAGKAEIRNKYLDKLICACVLAEHEQNPEASGRRPRVDHDHSQHS